jgi:uncharacterized protein YndB with AHSA1/START domain
MNRMTLDTGPIAEVDCHPDGNRWTLVFVRALAHPPERVWAALTDPEQLRQWAPFDADRDLGQVGDATLTMVDREIREDLAARVTRAERPSLLEYTWGDDRIRWNLSATETGTRLVLRHTLARRRGAPMAAAGWHLCLVVAERLLEGEPIGPIRGRDARDHGWDELHDAYAEKLGIEGGGATGARAG